MADKAAEEDAAATAAAAARMDQVLPFVLSAEQRNALFSAYAEPIRAYHHIGHVAEVLGHYATVTEGPGWQRPHETAWAVLYHDAIYRPGRSDNETNSAQLALDHFDRWPPTRAIDRSRIVALIELTARHGRLRREDLLSADSPNGDIDDTLHFLDCDMAILGAPSVRFDAYDRAIADEYSAVPRWLYRHKRRRFFRMLLDADRIFLSDFFHSRLDAPARDNLRRTLATA